MAYLDLDDPAAYQQWATTKRELYRHREDNDFALLLDIDGNGNIDRQTLDLLREQIDAYNFALYRMTDDCIHSVDAIRNIGRQLGLREMDKNLCAQEDRLTRLTVQDQGRGHQYIPYSNKAIGWHTDGYYNPMHQRVLAMVLHCEQPAAKGGVNDLLDHDMVYIHLRDENPEYIRALSQPGVMCIPENIENGVMLRPQTCSAVFMQEQRGERERLPGPALAMRYSRRKRNIIWPDDTLTREALACLLEFLDSQSPYHVTYRLNAGEGVICNNVLHTRSAFTDGESAKRVYYRARYYNRINF